jgi:hypothetical protein
MAFFLTNLSPEVLGEILSRLSPKELNDARRTSRQFEKLCDENAIWEKFLKKEHQIRPYKNTYIQHPEARQPGHIHYDQTGRDYLNSLIDQELHNNQTLTDTQRAHLGSALVRKLIQNEKLTITQAVQDSSPSQVEGLNADQIRGIKDGLTRECIKADLTREQVNHDWFKNPHAHAAKNGIPYEQYQGLSYDAARGVSDGLHRPKHNFSSVI